MARKVIWGTPGRSADYLRPRAAGTLVRPAWLLVALLGLLALGAQFAAWRAPLSPGALSARHASYDARCQECHAPRGAGAASVRCQRCHDPASGERLTLQAHVYFGSLDAARAARAGEMACARCHVEHQGAARDLRRVEDALCVDCHDDPARVAAPLRRLEQHPEFDVLARGGRQATGLIFNHKTHVTRGRGKPAGYLTIDRELRARGVERPADTCSECHLRKSGEADFEPIQFEKHCLSCHRNDAFKLVGVPADQVVSFETLDESRVEGWRARAEDFKRNGELIEKRLQHADEWLRFNLDKLRRELDPQGSAAELRALQQRRALLERRLALAPPLAGYDGPALAARVEVVRQELARLDERARAQEQAGLPAAGLQRLEDVAGAAAALGAGDEGARAEALAQRGRAAASVPGLAAPLSRADFEARRDELLRVLQAVQDAAPARAAQVQELRRQIESLQAGEVGAERLERARAQRRQALERLEDEQRLRADGQAPAAGALLRQEIRARERDLARAERELALLALLPAPRTQPLTEAERERKEEAVASLTVGCRYCHEISPQGAFARVAAARPVLRRAAFRHREHLTHGESCLDCHAGQRGAQSFSIEQSGQASDLSLRGIDSCRACHRRGQATRDCRGCHDFHPKDAP